MRNAVEIFEQSLRRATMRKGHDDQIMEVVSHYHDLYQEALSKGATIEEAGKHADDLIGNVSEIAKGIREGNGKSSGARLQWIAATLFAFGALLARVMGLNGYEIGSLWGRVIEASDPIGLIMVYLAGFLAVLGILRAKRISIPAFCLAIAMIFLSQTAILLRHSRSFSVYDAKIQKVNDNWHQYSTIYRPILAERYNLYVAGITGTQPESDDAIRKLSSSVKRPQDRGAVFLPGDKGKWIYPLKDQEVRDRNIRVFPFRDDNLNWVHFGATDSFDLAQKKWRSSDELLKAIPILRKGSEAEFALTAKKRMPSAMTAILADVKASVLQFLYSLALSFLMFGIATNIKKLSQRSRRAL